MIKEINTINQEADKLPQERHDLAPIAQLFIYWPLIKAALKLALVFIWRKKPRTWIHGIIAWGDFTTEHRR